MTTTTTIPRVLRVNQSIEDRLIAAKRHDMAHVPPTIKIKSIESNMNNNSSSITTDSTTRKSTLTPSKQQHQLQPHTQLLPSTHQKTPQLDQPYMRFIPSSIMHKNSKKPQTSLSYCDEIQLSTFIELKESIEMQKHLAQQQQQQQHQYLTQYKKQAQRQQKPMRLKFANETLNIESNDDHIFLNRRYKHHRAYNSLSKVGNNTSQQQQSLQLKQQQQQHDDQQQQEVSIKHLEISEAASPTKVPMPLDSDRRNNFSRIALDSLLNKKRAKNNEITATCEQTNKFNQTVVYQTSSTPQQNEKLPYNSSSSVLAPHTTSLPSNPLQVIQKAINIQDSLTAKVLDRKKIDIPSRMFSSMRSITDEHPQLQSELQPIHQIDSTTGDAGQKSTDISDSPRGSQQQQPNNTQQQQQSLTSAKRVRISSYRQKPDSMVKTSQQTTQPQLPTRGIRSTTFVSQSQGNRNYNSSNSTATTTAKQQSMNNTNNGIASKDKTLLSRAKSTTKRGAFSAPLTASISLSINNTLTSPDVSSKGWALLSCSSNPSTITPAGQLPVQFLCGKNPSYQVEVASLTKIMTCYFTIIFFESKGLDMHKVYFEVSQEATEMIGTSANLEKGDYISAFELLFGLMLPSGNDAAVVLSEGVGYLLLRYENNAPLGLTALVGDYLAVTNKLKKDAGGLAACTNAFLKEMNIFAKDIGMDKTNYACVHGLPNRSNVSTAKDIGVLSCVAMQHELFAKVVNTQEYDSKYVVDASLQKGDQYEWENTNFMLEKNGYDGVKTGVTDVAGPCLSTSYKAVRNGQNIRILCVLLNCKSMDDRWAETKELVQWALKHFHQENKP